MRILLTGNTGFKIANFRAGLIRTLRTLGHEVIVLVPSDGYVENLKAMGCQVVDLPMDRSSTSPWIEARTLHAIYRTLRSLRPDYVFSFTIKNNIYAGLACRRLGISFSANVTGLGPAFNDSGLLNRGIRVLLRHAFRRAQVVFFQNTHDREIFLSAGLVQPEQTYLLPGSGVDLAYFAPQPLPASSSKVFLLVARLLRDKGIEIYAEAAKRLRRHHPDAIFRLLGPLDPDSRASVSRTQINEWTQSGLLEYLGESQDVRPALAASHCVVLPSFYREGTPRALLEAAATGRPIITTNMPGCRDTVISGETGLLVAPRSAEELCDAMRYICDLPRDQLIAMAEGGRALMEARYDEKIVIERYVNLLISAGDPTDDS